MIDFSKIDQFSWKYQIYNAYLRFTHNYFYYKEFRVINVENIPKKGVPTFIISNHQNGLTDALVLLYMFPDHRQPVFIARGDIFKKDRIAKIMRFLKILPSFRTRDGDRNDVRANSEVFDIAANVLDRGNTLIMFPEASHQGGHYMGTFKKGFPRIAFAAEEDKNFALGLQIIPVNIHYQDYYNFRGKVLLTVGEPFQLDSLFDLYRSEPNQAYLELNNIAREKVKEITLDEDPEFFREYDLIREMLHSQRLIGKGVDPNNLYEEKLEDMRIVKELDEIKQNSPEDFAELMDNTKEYALGLKQLKLRDWLINSNVSFASLLGKSFLALITFPFFLIGLIGNFLPFKFPELLKRKIKDRQLHSSMNFAPSVVLTFPLMYLIWFIVFWIISGKFWIGLIAACTALLFLFVYYRYKKAFIKLRGAWRYYSLQKKKSPLILKLIQLKSQITSKMGRN